MARAGRIDGALTTCGIVAGAIQLNNYQLDGEYVMAKLLATTPIQLVNFFPNFGAACPSFLGWTHRMYLVMCLTAEWMRRSARPTSA